MFRTTKYCDRYEFISFELDTPITLPGVDVRQEKSGYSFSINERTAYLDWYKAYFSVKFKVVKMDNTNFGPNDRIAPISDVISLISNLQVLLNSVSIYDVNNTYRATHIRNLLNKSSSNTRTISTNEFYFPDEARTTVTDKTQADYNKGFHDRQLSIAEGREEDVKIRLNKFAFFEGLNKSILPPTQMKLEFRLTDDNTALYKAAGVDDGKVIITKLVLWVPKLNLNAEGMNLVTERYLSPNTTWSYLHETVSESTSGRQEEGIWQITSAVKKPRHVFVYLQKSNKNTSQTENVHILDTFSMGAARLSSARLEVGNGAFYPEKAYSLNTMSRIYGDVIEFTHREDNEDTDLFLTRDRFTDLYGMLYFNLTYNPGNLNYDSNKLVLEYKLNRVPVDEYKLYAIILHEKDIMVNMVGTEISII